MGLLVTAIMAIFILPIIIGIVMSKKSKKVAIALFCIPFVFTAGMIIWWIYEINDRFIANTDLAKEQIEPFLLFDEPTEETLESYGTFEEEDDELFDRMLTYEGFSLGIDQAGELVYIQVTEEGQETARGVQIGDSVEFVEELYGTDTYTTKDTGEGVAQNYVDRDHKKHIQFFEEDGSITKIILFKK